VVDRALRELVERRTRPSIRQLFGIGGVAPDYDPKMPWAESAEAGQYRVEQPRAVYLQPDRGTRSRSRPRDKPKDKKGR
jgi:hypothetical protein